MASSFLWRHLDYQLWQLVVALAVQAAVESCCPPRTVWVVVEMAYLFLVLPWFLVETQVLEARVSVLDCSSHHQVRGFAHRFVYVAHAQHRDLKVSVAVPGHCQKRSQTATARSHWRCYYENGRGLSFGGGGSLCDTLEAIPKRWFARRKTHTAEWSDVKPHVMHSSKTHTTQVLCHSTQTNITIYLIITRAVYLDGELLSSGGASVDPLAICSRLSYRKNAFQSRKIGSTVPYILDFTRSSK